MRQPTDPEINTCLFGAAFVGLCIFDPRLVAIMALVAGVATVGCLGATAIRRAWHGGAPKP